MGIRNLKYTISLLAIATTISLTGCTKNNSEQKVLKVYESENKESNFSKYDLNDNSKFDYQIVDSIMKESCESVKDNYYLWYTDLPGRLIYTNKGVVSERGTMYINLWKNEKKSRMTPFGDNFYNGLNYLLFFDFNYALNLVDIGDELDFEKIDFTNIKSIYIQNNRKNYEHAGQTVEINYDYFDLETLNKIMNNSKDSDYSILVKQIGC